MSESFVHLLRVKYENSYNEETARAKGIEIYIKHKPTLSTLTLAALNNTSLSSAGPIGEISASCPNIQELDISNTKITNWEDLLQIVSELKSLTYLKISGLRLDPDTFTSAKACVNLTSLSMSGNTFSIDQLKCMSDSFPGVENLVLKECILPQLDSIFQNFFSNVSSLNLNNAGIQEWRDIRILGDLPNLSSLKLSRNPIQEIDEMEFGSRFKALKYINLEETLLNCLKSVHNLNALPELANVRIGNTPLNMRFQEHFYNIIVSYLERIQYFSGGLIRERGRAGAERQFVREFNDENNPGNHISQGEGRNWIINSLLPSEIPVNTLVFNRLFEKHGLVHKFAEVNLTAPTSATILIEVEDGRSETQTVSLKWTARELKELVSVLFDIPKSVQKLYYGDHEALSVFGFDLIRFDSIPLSRMGFKDNDILQVKFNSRRAKTLYKKR
jgi:hypothetical protein